MKKKLYENILYLKRKENNNKEWRMKNVKLHNCQLPKVVVS